MAGLGIRLFTDEMVNPRVAWTLARRGYEVQSCHWAGRANQRISDDLQLAYATEQSRAILTFNATDFERLDLRWKLLGRSHAGIIIADQIRDLVEFTRRVKLHLDTVNPVDQYNAVLDLAV